MVPARGFEPRTGAKSLGQAEAVVPLNFKPMSHRTTASRQLTSVRCQDCCRGRSGCVDVSAPATSRQVAAPLAPSPRRDRRTTELASRQCWSVSRSRGRQRVGQELGWLGDTDGRSTSSGRGDHAARHLAPVRRGHDPRARSRPRPSRPAGHGRTRCHRWRTPCDGLLLASRASG